MLSGAMHSSFESNTTLVVDNYDSFTHLIVQYLRQSNATVHVIKNDEMSATDALGLSPARILLSPGPGSPDESGICRAILDRAIGKLPVLGVCLGHQIIAKHFGGQVTNAPRVMHGKASTIRHNNTGAFANIPQSTAVGRYHSLIVAPDDPGDGLHISAIVENAGFGMEIMGLQHKDYAIEGIQFHPESILTSVGRPMFDSFLSMHDPKLNTPPPPSLTL